MSRRRREEGARPALPRRREPARRDRPARRARLRRRRARDRAGPRRADPLPRRPRRPRPRRRARPLARAAAAERSRAATNVELDLGDALPLDLAALEPPPTKLVANLPYNVATPIVVESLDGLPGRRALVRDGAARGRRPLLRAALDEGLRCGLGARPARGRAHRLPSGLAHGLPATAERGLGARRLPAPTAPARTSRREAARRRLPSPTGARRCRTRSSWRASQPVTRRPRRCDAIGREPAVARRGARRPPEFVALARGARRVNRAPAPAKLNLALVVGPPRADGKHEVATVCTARPGRPRLDRAGGRAPGRGLRRATPSSARRWSARRAADAEPRWQARIWKQSRRGRARRWQLGRGDGAAARQRDARRPLAPERLHELAACARRGRPLLSRSGPPARHRRPARSSSRSTSRRTTGSCSSSQTQSGKVDRLGLRRLRRRDGADGFEERRARLHEALARPSVRATSQRCRRTTSPLATRGRLLELGPSGRT